jgi:hypothetical protein
VGLFRAADRLDNWALPKLQDFIDGWPGVAFLIGNMFIALGLFAYADRWDFSQTAAWGLAIGWMGACFGIVLYVRARKRRSADGSENLTQ